MKTIKRMRKEIRKLQPNLLDMFETLKTWPFRQRLRMAWLLIKGKKKESSYTATMDSSGKEVK